MSSPFDVCYVLFLKRIDDFTSEDEYLAQDVDINVHMYMLHCTWTNVVFILTLAYGILKNLSELVLSLLTAMNSLEK
jgi:hypothetical protein